MDKRGDIKLCDFGISGQLVDSIAKTRDAGCRPYMAVMKLVNTSIKSRAHSILFFRKFSLNESIRNHQREDMTSAVMFGRWELHWSK